MKYAFALIDPPLQPLLDARVTRYTLTALVILSPLHLLSAGVIFSDTFSGSGSPDAHWVDEDSTNASVNVSGGNLNVNTGNVNGLTAARHTLELSGTGSPSVTLASSWTIEVDMLIADLTALQTMAGGEGAGITLDVRDPNAGPTERAQINFVMINFGGGPEFATRGASETNGTTSENITNLGSAASPITATARMSYDETSGLISTGLDTGSGFFLLVDPVDTSAWNMLDSDQFLVRLEMGMVSFSGDPASSTFSIEDGEVAVSEFRLYDEALTIVPEPSTAFMALLGATGLCLRRKRK